MNYAYLLLLCHSQMITQFQKNISQITKLIIEKIDNINSNAVFFYHSTYLLLKYNSERSIIGPI